MNKEVKKFIKNHKIDQALFISAAEYSISDSSTECIKVKKFQSHNINNTSYLLYVNGKLVGKTNCGILQEARMSNEPRKIYNYMRRQYKIQSVKNNIMARLCIWKYKLNNIHQSIEARINNRKRIMADKKQKLQQAQQERAAINTGIQVALSEMLQKHK